MITVEPVSLVFIEHLHDDGRRVEGAEREGFELEQAAEVGLRIFASEEHILEAHPEFPADVNTRFVRNGHAGHEGGGAGGIGVFANLLRPFMHAEVAANAVSCAVSEIHTFLPHGIAGGKIEHQALCALREAGARQSDVTFQHEGVGFALFVGERTEGNGAGDVGRAAYIMRTAVEQQETAGSERRVAFFVGFVVHNGTVCAVTGNGAEGKTAKVGVFCAKRGEALLDREFRFLADLTFFDDFIECSAKTHHGYTVQLHGAAETGNFAFIFDGAQGGDGRDGGGTNGV